MGHGHHDTHEHVNHHATQEADDQLPLRVRPIELIKHNPNLFHVSPFDLPAVFEILGGAPFAASTALGGALGFWYYSNKARHTPATFYSSILLTFSRIALGGILGAWFGYAKFGDRQRLQNAWVAERLRRRYPESLSLTTTNLWRFKGVTASQSFYRWT
jgi:hypothetical protein